jgi:hypothetical protein
VADYGLSVSTPKIPDPRRLGVPKEVVNEAARTLRNARKSFDNFLNGVADAAPEGSPAAADKAWVAASHHRQCSGLLHDRVTP